MSRAAQAVKHQVEAQRRRALAPANDPIRRYFELGLANRMEAEAQALLTPPKPQRNTYWNFTASVIERTLDLFSTRGN